MWRDIADLTDNEIIGLIKSIHAQLEDQDVETRVRLEIKSNYSYGEGFSDRLSIYSKVELYSHEDLAGIISGVHHDMAITHEVYGIKKRISFIRWVFK